MIKKKSKQTTYQQPRKEKARKLIWENIFNDLCGERNESLVINPEYVENLWKYCFKEILIKRGYCFKYNRSYFQKWKKFSESEYSVKTPQDLKILYLSGPEPQNDLEIILKLGGQIQNIIALESDNRHYVDALKIAQSHYPELKIFKDKLDSFFNFYQGKFDVVYCDFTGPLFSKETKALNTLNQLFENKILNPLSKVVINSCLPDKTEENVRFLSNYFLYQPKVENKVIDQDFKYDSTVSFSDPLSAYGLSNVKQLDKHISKSFRESYSAFCTHYVPTLAGVIIPAYIALSSNSIKKHLFEEDKKIEDALKLMSGKDKTINDWIENDCIGLEKNISPERYPFENFLNNLERSTKGSISHYWYQQFEQKKKIRQLKESLSLYNLLVTSTEGYSSILSNDLLNSIKKIHNSMPDGNHRALFCDISFPYLWLQLTIAHMGGAYHVNTEKHYRFSYTSKKREMLVDIFTLDRCLNLYNWLPFYNTYGELFETLENQMIVRSCINAIGRQSFELLPNLFYGSNLIELYNAKYPWAKYVSLMTRKRI